MVYGHFETLPLRDWILRDYCQFLVLDTSRPMSGHLETIGFGHFETASVSKWPKWKYLEIAMFCNDLAF